MVELAVELLELVKTEIRDRRGITARINTVSIVREQGLLRRARHQRIRTTINSFHLVVDDSTIR